MAHFEFSNIKKDKKPEESTVQTESESEPEDIYEDEDFNVILDASPATKGHALILPKQHYANMFEIDDEILAKAAKLAKRVITHEKEVLGCDGYNVLQNNGEVAGQTVFHFHMHLIPRYDGEKTIIDWDHKEFSDDEMKAICNEMKL